MRLMSQICRTMRRNGTEKKTFEINLDLYTNKYLFLYILHNIDNKTMERINESFVSFKSSVLVRKSI